MLTMRFPSTCFAAASAALILASSALGQTSGTVPPPPATTAPQATTAEDVITLSPFEVTADAFEGYQASNVLSGTRLNSRLADLSMPITVVTKQQMIDTASVSLNDMFLYEANTEGTGTYTSITPNRDGGINDNVQADPYRANRIRGLSAANIAVNNFPSNPRIPIDPYNIEALEISRGPNSNIFGLGAGSGTLNLVPIRANPNSEINSITARIDSRGGYRGTLDFNRPLIEDVLGLRFSAVSDSRRFRQKPSYEDIERAQISGLYRPFKRTTIRASAEFYRNEAQRPNSITPRETITDWLAYGQPTWDPTTRRVTFADGTQTGTFNVNQDATLPLGLLAQGGSFYNRTPLFVEPDGTITYWGVNRTGSQPTPLNRNQNLRMLQSGTLLDRQRSSLYPLFFDAGVTDKSVYDYERINMLAPNYVRDKARTYMVELEQFFIDTPNQLLAGRAGFFRQEFERYDRSMISGNDSVIFVDVNQKLLDGTPNPNFRRPYIAGAFPTTLRVPEDDEVQTLDLAYQFTPGRDRGQTNWIGVQRFNLHGERRLTASTNYRFRDFIVSDHAWINPLDRTASNQSLFQYYLGGPVGTDSIQAPTSVSDLSGTYPFTWFRSPNWITEQATLAEEAITGTTTTKRKIHSGNLTYQGFFWDDRFIPTVGVRRDRQSGRNSDAVEIDPATGFITYDPLDDYSQDWVRQAGNTRTYGAVVRPISWLNLFYNKANSFDPAGIQYNIYEELLPNPTSRGEDYGVSVSMLQNRLFFRVTRYKTEELNSRRGQIGTIGSRVHRLEGARQPYAESFLPWAENVARTRFQNQGITPTPDQVFNAAAEIMGVSPEFLRSTAASGAVGEPVDITSSGYEFELTFNPTRNWRFKLTAAQQQAIDSNIGDTISNYLADRLPIWTTAADDQGNRWWDANNGAARLRYLSDIRAPYLFEVANSGNKRAQVREWSWTGLTNYDFTEGALRNWNIGGAVRWIDKAAIGYYGRAPENGVILELDPQRPIYDKARYSFDMNVGYRFRVGEMRGRVQLNVRDIFEDGRLQPVGANPDGTPYAFRIVDPRLFILSTTFDF
jgi:outer membrane receptor protein involved in Fe transport